MAPDDLGSLIARLGTTGDPAVLGELFDRAAPGLLRLALRVTGDPTEAEDVLQETFLAVLRGARTYDPSRPAGAWLATVLSHAAARRRRRKRPQVLPKWDVDRVAAPLARTDPEAWRRARLAIEGLPAREKSALLLRHEHGLPTARIAEILGIEASSVRGLLTRGTERLRKRLGPSSVALLPLAPWPSLQHLLTHVRDRLLEGAATSAAVAGGSMAATTWLAGGLLVTHKGGVVAAAAVVLLAGGGAWWHLAAPGEREAPPARSAPLEADPTAASTAPQLEGVASTASFVGTARVASARARYSGTLRDADGKPIPGAWLELTEAIAVKEIDVAAFPRIVPDDRGGFGFDVPGALGQVTVRVHAESHVPLWGGADGQHVFPNRPLELVLVRGAALDFLVLEDATEKPVPGAVVGAYDPPDSHADAWRQQRPKSTATTDGTGRARVLGKGDDGYVTVRAAGLRTAFVPLSRLDRDGTTRTVRLLRGTRMLGRFVDVAGRPKAGVLVQASGFPPYETQATSDADGRFTLENAPSQAEPRDIHAGWRLLLFAQIPGSGERPRYFRVEPAAAEGGTAEVTLVWASRRTLSGRVRTAAGEPVADLWVVAQPAWAHEIHRSVEPVRTDAQGRFELVDCVPDRLRVQATRSEWKGGGMALAETVVVLPPEGEAAEVDLVVTASGAPTRPLNVRVLDPQGVPLAGARVRVPLWLPSGAETYGQPKPDADGTTTLTAGVRAGTALTVGAPGWAPLRMEVTESQLAAGRVDVTMPSGVVRGRVVRSDGTPQAVVLRIHGMRKVPGATFRIGVHGPDMEQPAPVEDGSFEFRGLGEGDYQLMLQYVGEWAVVGGSVPVRAGQTDVRVVVVSREQAQAQQVEVELLDEIGQPLRGWYLNPWLVPVGGKPEGDPVAFLQQVQGTEHLYRTWHPVPRGMYDVVVPAMFGMREGRATGVEVPAKRRWTVRLDKGLRVRGRVTDDAGQPAKGVMVRSGEQGGRVGEDGTYEITGLEEGEVVVRVDHDHAQSEPRTVRLAPGEPLRVDFQVVTGGAIRLAVPHGVRPVRGLRAEATPLGSGAPRVLDVTGDDLVERRGWVFARLAPGRWRVDVEWDGRRITSQEVEVKDRETVTVTLAP